VSAHYPNHSQLSNLLSPLLDMPTPPQGAAAKKAAAKAMTRERFLVYIESDDMGAPTTYSIDLDVSADKSIVKCHEVLEFLDWAVCPEEGKEVSSVVVSEVIADSDGLKSFNIDVRNHFSCPGVRLSYAQLRYCPTLSLWAASLNVYRDSDDAADPNDAIPITSLRVVNGSGRTELINDACADAIALASAMDTIRSFEPWRRAMKPGDGERLREALVAGAIRWASRGGDDAVNSRGQKARGCTATVMRDAELLRFYQAIGAQYDPANTLNYLTTLTTQGALKRAVGWMTDSQSVKDYATEAADYIIEGVWRASIVASVQSLASTSVGGLASTPLTPAAVHRLRHLPSAEFNAYAARGRAIMEGIDAALLPFSPTSPACSPPGTPRMLTSEEEAAAALLPFSPTSPRWMGCPSTPPHA
jgi:hypothetical protein